MTQQASRCGVCGGRMKAKRENTKYECGLDGVTLMGVTVGKCLTCGEREVEIQNILGLHQALARALATRPTRLGPRQLRFLRKYLGLSSDNQPTDRPTERLLRSMTLREKPRRGWHVVQASEQGLKAKRA